MRHVASVTMIALCLAGCGSGGGDDGGDDVTGDGGTDGIPSDGIPAIDAPPGPPASMRFFGTRTPGADRIEIRLDPHVPADVGAGSFSIEFWYRNAPGTTLVSGCTTVVENWRRGNVIVDRDTSGAGRSGDFGFAIFATEVGFGISRGATGVGLCGSVPGTASGWHHVAATRDAGSQAVVLYIDGMMRASTTGPTGDVSYQDGSTGAAKDPFLVLGAEKHDAGPQFPSFNGFVAELRISTTVRWTADFLPPTAAYAVDADTAALYHFDQGGGPVLVDARGTSPGEVKFGTDTTGSEVPYWATATPFL